MKNSPIVKLVLLVMINFCLFSVHAQPAKPVSKVPAAKTPVAAPKQPAKPTETSKKFSVYFDVNQSKIKPNDYKVLDSVVAILSTQANIRRIQITGYADTTGGAEANMILSDNRTDTVAGYILSKNLKHYKSKISTSSLGEKVTGKETDLNEMRRVDVVLYMARPDRDTVIKVGCASAIIKANTFEGFNNDEVIFKLEYIGTDADAKKHNLSFVDDKGKQLLSNGVVRLSATYKGKPIKAIQPVLIKIPRINKEGGYNLYKGIEEKGKPVTWKQIDGNITDLGISTGSNNENCDLISFSIKDLNVYHNADKERPSCYCAADHFGGVQTPEHTEELARFGPDKSIVLLNDGAFKKVEAGKAYVQVVDNLYPNEFLNFCNGFLLPGVGEVPEIAKFDREIVKFIDFNVSQKNDTADQIMVKKTKVLLMIPKSKHPAHEGKQYAVFFADTKKDNFLNWSNKIVYNSPCMGLSNCDYWVFEVPFSGFYSLVELTPNEEKTGKPGKGSKEENEDHPKYVKIKTKKYNDVHVVYGAKDENTTQMAKFVKNKGKNSVNEPAIAKKDKKQYKQHIFLAYVIISGKRYAWIGKGSELKKGLFSGNWKTPKLVYVPDEDWEAFVKKACE